MKTKIEIHVDLESSHHINGFTYDRPYRLRIDSNKVPYIRLLGERVDITQPNSKVIVDSATFRLKVSNPEEFAKLVA